MLNEKLIKQNTLEKIKKAADDMECRYRIEIENMFSRYLPEAKRSLEKEIKRLYTIYQEAEKQGETGSLEWINISFLRSSLLDAYPCYRIDLYDSRGCISEEECAGMWDYHYVFDFYYKIKKQIMEMVERQNRLRPYETEEILRHVSDSLRTVSDEQIVQIVRLMHSGFIPMTVKEHSLKIMVGDYLDETVLADEIWYEEME